jgi:hypothetical protein
VHLKWEDLEDLELHAHPHLHHLSNQLNNVFLSPFKYAVVLSHSNLCHHHHHHHKCHSLNIAHHQCPNNTNIAHLCNNNNIVYLHHHLHQPIQATVTVTAEEITTAQSQLFKNQPLHHQKNLVPRRPYVKR